MEKYLSQNRKTRHKSARIRIQSSPANIRDCSNRVASPQKLRRTVAGTPANR